MKIKSALKRAFRGFDINNVDLSMAWSWPYGIKYLAYLGVFTLTLGLGASFFVLDKHKALQLDITQEADLKNQISIKSFQVSKLPALKRQMEDVEQRFAELLNQLPTDQEVPDLLEDISKIGKKSGLEIVSIALEAEQSAPFYVELPISIQVTGTYHQMGDFVSGVSGIKRIVTLHNYRLKPLGDQQLMMNISARTYRYDEG